VSSYVTVEQLVLLYHHFKQTNKQITSLVIIKTSTYRLLSAIAQREIDALIGLPFRVLIANRSAMAANFHLSNNRTPAAINVGEQAVCACVQEAVCVRVF